MLRRLPLVPLQCSTEPAQRPYRRLAVKLKVDVHVGRFKGRAWSWFYCSEMGLSVPTYG